MLRPLFRGIMLCTVVGCSLLLSLLTLRGQVPAPADVFGFQPGDDYKLARYDQMIDYYRKLAASSDRVVLREIGETVLDRPLLQMFISTPANLARLDHWRSISASLARAKIGDEEARRLAEEGKVVVWIDGGLHATEVAHGQMTPLLAHRVATEESPEMEKIRENVILLLMPVMNPDGLEIVADWYQEVLDTPFETTRPPELYHHYVGHDNNRDWFMGNMPETQGVNRVLYREWYPQIIYNHHQTGPAWARIFIPPFTDPVNPRIHAGVTTGVNLVGSAMANRFAIKEMPGVVSDMIYSMWWNGGMRTVPYFHNMIGILSETSHATPSPRYYDPEKRPSMVGNPRRGQAAPTSGTDIFYPNPWKGGPSHFSDPIRYMITGSMAVLDVAASMRQQWLLNIYRMGRSAIEVEEGPSAYVIPAIQWDSGEALNMLNVLFDGGIEIFRADADFSAEGRPFRRGDFIIPGAQAFRPYLLDLMEPQEYPDRRRTPNGPPDPPYDIAGWTLPIQMGVEFTRATRPVNVALSPVTERLRPEPAALPPKAGFGYAISRRENASFRVINRLLAEGKSVFLARESFRSGGHDFPVGTFVIDETDLGESLPVARSLGVELRPLNQRPSAGLELLQRPRIGLYKSWVANMDEGWTRWILDDYGFPYEQLTDEDLRQSPLSRFNVILLPSQEADEMLNGHAPGTMPDDYVGGMGLEGALRLQRYVAAGGRLVALDAASDFVISNFGLPITNAVAGVAAEDFFIPGSLISMDVDAGHFLAHGMREKSAASFVRSRAFEIVELGPPREGGVENLEKAPAPDVDIVARYPEKDLLMSGWALGAESNIGGKPAMLRAGLGDGEAILIGFRPQFRGQPRGTYKLLFNSLYRTTSGN